jgi:hypothetical protein
MLRFVVPLIAGWSPSQAHLVGPDDLAIPGEVNLTPAKPTDGHIQGIIEAKKRTPGAAGLAIQYPVPGPAGGLLTLRTTLLPERQQPYLLTLELARHQVMLMLNKLEEWALFDQPTTEQAMIKMDAALAAYTHALVVQQRSAGTSNGGFSDQAEAAAQKALALAIDAGEALALLAAKTSHAKRTSGELARIAARAAPAQALTDHESNESKRRAAGSTGVILTDVPAIGVGVSPAAFGAPLCDAIASLADHVTVPMRWSEMEPSEGKYAFSRVDKWIEWAVTKAKLPVIAGPVLEFDAGCVPDFLYIWEHDYETLREVVVEHLKNVVTRYRRTVHTWTICSGLHVASNFAISYEQAVDLTRLCVLIVRKLHPAAKVQIELAQPWGEYTAELGARGARSIPPAVYCELLKQVNVEVDAIAVKVQMGLPMAGRNTRDLIAFSSLLDRLGALEKPISITALGAPAMPHQPGSDQPLPGHWRASWSEQHQATWLKHVGAIAASKPFVKSITWAEIVDAPSPAAPGCGLLNGQGQARPVYGALRELRLALQNRQALPGCA